LLGGITLMRIHFKAAKSQRNPCLTFRQSCRFRSGRGDGGAFATVRWMLRSLERSGGAFGWYRITLGILVLALLAQGNHQWKTGNFVVPWLSDESLAASIYSELGQKLARLPDCLHHGGRNAPGVGRASQWHQRWPLGGASSPRQPPAAPLDRCGESENEELRGSVNSYSKAEAQEQSAFAGGDDPQPRTVAGIIVIEGNRSGERRPGLCGFVFSRSAFSLRFSAKHLFSQVPR